MRSTDRLAVAGDGRSGDLEAIVRGSPWFMAVLRAVRAVDPPGWWVGAGVLRDLVWGTLHGDFDPSRVKDVDVAFFDPRDWSEEREQAVEDAPARELPGVCWDAKNQAAVHTWYERKSGQPAAPLTSTADGVSTWPETATAVAVRLDLHGRLHVLAPCGLDDLLDGVCRRNPRRVTLEAFRARVVAKGIRERWPRVRVIDG